MHLVGEIHGPYLSHLRSNVGRASSRCAGVTQFGLPPVQVTGGLEASSRVLSGSPPTAPAGRYPAAASSVHYLCPYPP